MGREGVGLQSPQTDGRLATGSLIHKIALEGDRLHYKKVSGAGPETGWISISLKGKPLAVRRPDQSPSSPSSTPTRKLRILALHGGGANINIMKFQTMQLQKLLKEHADWHFLNGRADWRMDVPDEFMKSLARDMPFYGWYRAQNDDPSDRTFLEKAFDPSVKFTYAEVDEGVDYVMKHIKEEGPYDVLLGFSQGCIIITLITALLMSRGEEPPWKLNLLFNGLPVRDNSYDHLFRDKLRHPALLVFGR